MQKVKDRKAKLEQCAEEKQAIREQIEEAEKQKEALLEGILEENEKSIGFLPEERAWVSKVVENGWSDVFRVKYPDTVVYSWWHVLSGARARNIGWRIDYFFVDKAKMKNVKRVEYLNDQMGSDHCPMLLEI